MDLDFVSLLCTKKVRLYSIIFCNSAVVAVVMVVVVVVVKTFYFLCRYFKLTSVGVSGLFVLVRVPTCESWLHQPLECEVILLDERKLCILWKNIAVTNIGHAHYTRQRLCSFSKVNLGDMHFWEMSLTHFI